MAHWLTVILFMFATAFVLWKLWMRRVARLQKPAAFKAIEAFEKQLVAQPEKEYVRADVFKLAEAYHYGKHGKHQNYQKALELYQRCDTGHAWIGIGKLYKDADWQRDPIRAFEAFYIAASKFGMEDGWLELGDLYMYGLHPVLLPDKQQAALVFQKLADHGSATGSDIARGKLEEIWKLGYAEDVDAIPRVDQSYVALPRLSLRELIVIQVPTMRRAPLAKRQSQTELMDLQTNNTRIDMDAEVAAGLVMPNERLLDIVPVQHVWSDSQNVHDSMVQKAVHKRLNEMHDTFGDTSPDTSPLKEFDAVLNYVPLDAQTKVDAKHVLTSLSDKVHSRYEQSEKDVFAKVWSRIQSPENSDRKEEMIKILAQSLASGVEHGYVVCSTGKIVRMMGALDGMDVKYETTGNALKPEWALRQEIANKAAHIQTTFEEANDIENVQGMKTALFDACTQDYVSSGLMTSAELEKIIKPYLEAFDV